MTTTIITPEELKQLVEGVKSIYAKYPRWMDKGDIVKTDKFRNQIKRAIELIDKKERGHDWIVAARSLLRDYDALRWSLDS